MTQPRPLVAAEDQFRWGWLFGGVWLVYLGSPLQASFRHTPGLMRDLGVVSTFAFAACYLVFIVRGRRQRLRGLRGSKWDWPQVAVLVGLMLLMTSGAHAHALAAGVFVAAFGMFTLRVRDAWILTFAVAIGSEIAVKTIPGWKDDGAAFGAVLASVAVFGLRIAFERNRRLLDTQDEMAGLAVSEERSRFARDLHDILGHSLTVIAIKAELAGRLVYVDADRAAAEVADLERLAREALADVRGAVSGYREITLSRELVTARSALTVAGIESDLPTAVDHVPGELRELFGWAVREGVTNVVRHSHATRCTIRVSAACLEVLDNGDGACEGASGNGLTGLQERAATLGGYVERSASDQGYRLAVVVPAKVSA